MFFITDKNITQIIHRSKGLDKAFLTNYRIEPSIGWQYFCNSSGLFRHFPVTNWAFHPINTYDCRLRHWFTGAASSPKDVMILIEKSGSMEGKRIGIAIDVARNILDTLTPNDFVNVMQFNGTAEYILECAKETLVQATSANIYELKLALNDIEPHSQANLSNVLPQAFENFERNKMNGANCEQVIMIITDGMEYNETIRRIFQKYSWDKGSNVRVFTYLIGEQIPEFDYEQVKRMACENRGYYTQIDTKSETREQTLKYISTMSKLTALSSGQNPATWSNLYVDMIDTTRTTNGDWDCKQREAQRERVVNYLGKHEWYPCITSKEPEKVNPEFRKYVFMTTVSMPAFERGVNSVRNVHFSTATLNFELKITVVHGRSCDRCAFI